MYTSKVLALNFDIWYLYWNSNSVTTPVSQRQGSKYPFIDKLFKLHHILKSPPATILFWIWFITVYSTIICWGLISSLKTQCNDSQHCKQGTDCRWKMGITKYTLYARTIELWSSLGTITACNMDTPCLPLNAQLRYLTVTFKCLFSLTGAWS